MYFLNTVVFIFFLLSIGYRDPKDVVEENKKKSIILLSINMLVERANKIRCNVIYDKIDNVTNDVEVKEAQEYKKWRECVLSKAKTNLKKKSCKQSTISSLFCKKS